MKHICGFIKRFFCLMLILALTGAGPVAQAASSASLATTGAKYTVTASRLNLRSGPGTDHSIITAVSRGREVTYLGYEDNWWRVRLADGRTGYMDRKYLAPASVGDTGSYFVTASSLRIRKEPTTKATTLGYLKKGTIITITRLNGDWGYVSSGSSRKGWVALKYVSSDTPGVSENHIVTASSLNVRSRASTRGTRLDSLPRGSVVRITQTDGNWGRITYKKSGETRKGWVALDYLKAE